MKIVIPGHFKSSLHRHGTRHRQLEAFAACEGSKTTTLLVDKFRRPPFGGKFSSLEITTLRSTIVKVSATGDDECTGRLHLLRNYSSPDNSIRERRVVGGVPRCHLPLVRHYTQLHNSTLLYLPLHLVLNEVNQLELVFVSDVIRLSTLRFCVAFWMLRLLWPVALGTRQWTRSSLIVPFSFFGIALLLRGQTCRFSSSLFCIISD